MEVSAIQGVQLPRSKEKVQSKTNSTQQIDFENLMLQLVGSINLSDGQTSIQENSQQLPDTEEDIFLEGLNTLGLQWNNLVQQKSQGETILKSDTTIDELLNRVTNHPAVIEKELTINDQKVLGKELDIIKDMADKNLLSMDKGLKSRLEEFMISSQEPKVMIKDGKEEGLVKKEQKFQGVYGTNENGPNKVSISEETFLSPRAFSLGNKFSMKDQSELPKEYQIKDEINQNQSTRFNNVIMEKHQEGSQTIKITPAIENMDQITQEMAGTIRKIKEGDQSVIQIKLKPEDLGDVEIKLHMKSGQVVGKILVENEMVKGVIENQIQHLRNQLKQQNIPLQAIEVDVSQFSQQQNHQNQSSFYYQGDTSKQQNQFEDDYENYLNEDEIYSNQQNQESSSLNLLA